MGNISSSGGGHGRRRSASRRSHPPPPPPQAPQPEITANRYVFAAATPYPPSSQYHNPNAPPYYQYPGYYPPPPPAAMPMPLPAPYDHHHPAAHANWVNGRYPYGPMMQTAPPPYVEHQKAVTIRNDVNLKKETLRIEADEENPGKYLVSFTYDATVAGRYTLPLSLSLYIISCLVDSC